MMPGVVDGNLSFLCVEEEVVPQKGQVCPGATMAAPPERDWKVLKKKRRNRVERLMMAVRKHPHLNKVSLVFLNLEYRRITVKTRARVKTRAKVKTRSRVKA